MTCRDFEAAWNDLLDAETPGRTREAEAARGVEGWRRRREDDAAGHAAACDACAAAHRRYLALRRAIRASHARIPLIPGPSTDLTERILSDLARASSRTRPSRILVPLALALAASVLGLLFLPARPGDVPTRPPARTMPPRLGHAVADATDATWDLAMTTSQPAARFGLQILDATTGGDDRDREGPEHDATDPASSGLLPSVFRSVAPARAGSDLLQDVGEGLTAGVRPLSARAREAFGFLRTPTFGRAGGTGPRPSSKGA